MPSFGIVSFNTNLTSFGVNYSQNGGFSGNYMGAQISRDGVSFSPSISASAMLYYYDVNAVTMEEASTATGANSKSNNGAIFQNDVELDTQINNEIGDLASIESELGTKIDLATYNRLNSWYVRQRYYINSNGQIKDNKGKDIGGITELKGGLFTKLNSKTYISPNLKGWRAENGVSMFKYVVNHEIIHAYHDLLLNQGVITKTQRSKYTEAIAYSYNLVYSKHYGISSQLGVIRSHTNNHLYGCPELMSWYNLSYLIKLW